MSPQLHKITKRPRTASAHTGAFDASLDATLFLAVCIVVSVLLYAAVSGLCCKYESAVHKEKPILQNRSATSNLLLCNDGGRGSREAS